MRTAGRYLGGWGAVVLVAVLLSFLFSFLGTITCAVLTGMMMGAVKQSRWFALPVSLVFPGVIFGLLRNPRTELAPGQVLALALVCFGAFWLTYLATAAMIFCERKAPRPPEARAPARKHETLELPGQAAPPDRAFAGGAGGTAVPASESGLEPWQGEWRSEASRTGESLHQRIIQVKAGEMELRAVDSSGRITLLARGDLKLQSLKPSQPVVHPNGSSESANSMVSI